jgi:hypothetical protein
MPSFPLLNANDLLIPLRFGPTEKDTNSLSDCITAGEGGGTIDRVLELIVMTLLFHRTGWRAQQ